MGFCLHRIITQNHFDNCVRAPAACQHRRCWFLGTCPARHLHVSCTLSATFPATPCLPFPCQDISPPHCPSTAMLSLLCCLIPGSAPPPRARLGLVAVEAPRLSCDDAAQVSLVLISGRRLSLHSPWQASPTRSVKRPSTGTFDSVEAGVYVMVGLEHCYFRHVETQAGWAAPPRCFGSWTTVCQWSSVLTCHHAVYWNGVGTGAVNSRRMLLPGLLHC